MMNQSNRGRLMVNITGVEGVSSNVSKLKSLEEIKISDRPELIPRYICAKLCNNREMYLSNVITHQQIFCIIQDMNLSEYFGEGKEYTDDIRYLLYYDIICNLRANALDISNKQALYDLLEI